MSDCGHVVFRLYVHTSLCALMSLCVDIQVPTVLYECILKIVHLLSLSMSLSVSRDILLWVHLCSHMCVCVPVYMDKYHVHVCT